MERFQEYAPNYLEGEQETELVDLASITMPISMIVGLDDDLCPHSQAEITASTIGDAVMHFESLEGIGHNDFWGLNEEWFIDLLIEQLQVPD